MTRGLETTGRRGLCIIDADRMLMQQPCLDATLEAIGLSPPPGPIDRRLARLATTLLAGTPTTTLEKVGRRLRFQDHVSETIQAVRRAGLALAITGTGYGPTMEIIGQRLQADVVAGIEGEVRYERLSGRLAATTWQGDCDRPICGAVVASMMRRQAPGSVVAIDDGDVDPCLASIARIVRPDELVEARDPWLRAQPTPARTAAATTAGDAR